MTKVNFVAEYSIPPKQQQQQQQQQTNNKTKNKNAELCVEKTKKQVAI